MFTAFLVVGLLISVISTSLILARIWITELNKSDILSLYADLRMSQIKKAFDQCDAYLDSLFQDGGVHTNLQITERIVSPAIKFTSPDND